MMERRHERLEDAGLRSSREQAVLRGQPVLFVECERERPLTYTWD